MSTNDDSRTEDDRISDDELEGAVGGVLLEPIVSRRKAMTKKQPIAKPNAPEPTFGKDGVLISGTTFPRGD